MFRFLPHRSGVEQLAARQAHNLKIAGSSPAPATKRGLLIGIGKWANGAWLQHEAG